MINHAKKLALKSNHRTHKHATLILKGGAIYSTGYNKDSMHAEMMAILNVKITSNRKDHHVALVERQLKLEGTSVINIMVTRSGNLGKSKPCIACRTWLKAHYVSKVTYYDGKDWITERVR